MKVGEKPLGPEVDLLPRILNTPKRLICRFGWSEETTTAFNTLDFEELELSGGPKQDFKIPDLGQKATSVKRLTIAVSGFIEGLEQFANVETLGIDHVPKGGLDLNKFRRVTSLFVLWNKARIVTLPNGPQLLELGLMGFPTIEERYLRSLTNLQAVSITQGSLKSIAGIETCKNLRELSLAYVKEFDDFATIAKCSGLHRISVENAPKLRGTLDISAFRDLQKAYLVKTPLTVDLSGLGRLVAIEHLWLAVPHINAKWNAIMSRPAIKSIGLLDGADTPTDDKIVAHAKAMGRSLASLRRVSERGVRQIQLTMSAQER